MLNKKFHSKYVDISLDTRNVLCDELLESGYFEDWNNMRKLDSWTDVL
jgi:hypothetical protein